MTPFDPYSVLGVGPSAGEHELKTAYRARSRLLHPDFHRDAGGHSPQAAHEAFSQLCSAYRVALSNLESPTVRGALPGLTDVLERPVAPAVPAASPAPIEARDGAGAWPELVLLLGVAVLGWFFVTDWLPAFLAYSAR
jgi:hypothetical protein